MDYKHEIINNDEHIPIKVVIHKLNTAYVSKHWHSDIELTYLLSGNIDMIYIDGIEYKVQSNDIFIINSNSIHSIFLNGNENILAVTILIPYNFIKDIYPDIDKSIFKCMSFSNEKEETKLAFDELRNVLKEIIEVYDGKYEYWKVKLNSLAYELVYFMLKNFRKNKKALQKTDNENLEKISLICNYVKENYKKEISITKISDLHRYSSVYLCRYFKKHMGMTIHQYIESIRFMNSYRDLINTNYSITYIALENGFPNEKSFTRVFKTIYQTTPEKYRKSFVQKNKAN